MKTSIGVRPWAEVAPLLVDVATGRRRPIWWSATAPGSTCIRGEVIPGTDLAIVSGPLRLLRAERQPRHRQGTKVVDAGGRYLVPGSATAICMSRAAW